MSIVVPKHFPLIGLEVIGALVGSNGDFGTVFFTLILVCTLRTLYFWKSTLKRDTDGDTDVWWHCVIVYFTGPFGLALVIQDLCEQPPVIDTWLYSIPFLLSAIYAADFMAGFVHFLGDVTQEYHFIYHHEDPLYMCSKSHVHHTAHSYMVAIPIYCFLYYVLFSRLYDPPLVISSDVWMWVRLMMLIAVQGNEFHHYAHCPQEQIGTVIRWLQDHHLFINREIHSKHHQEPYNQQYCTVTGCMWVFSLLHILYRDLTLFALGLGANSLLNWITISISSSVRIQNLYPRRTPATKPTYNPFH